jgi:tetratricopeptide (TPR) repeat protein
VEGTGEAAPVAAPVTEPESPRAAPAAPPPSPARALLTKASAAVRAEAFDRALILLNQAVAADPGYADALWNLAVLQDSYLKQPARAEKTYRLFAERFPDDPRARQIPSRKPEPAPSPADAEGKKERLTDRAAALQAWQKALVAHAAGQYDHAIEQYRVALEHDPRMNNAAFNLGLVCRKQGEFDSALGAFEQAVAADPRMPKAHYMLSVVYREMDEKKKAIEHAVRAVQLRPDYTRAHLILGFLYRDTLQYDRAREHFRNAVVHAPDKETAEKARAWLDSTKGLKTDR